ncbi:hypothetical protein MMC11_003145 [Xylographa trunciseda]|nr:hypothetical protein [Xylographa trunciseda]
MNQDTKTLASRQASPQEQEIIDEVLSLYQAKPTDKSYAHYSPTAVFHDPVSIAKGLPSIQSQFNGMPKAFSSSTTESYRVLADPSHPDSIRLDLTQHYVFKTGQEKTLNSLVTLRLHNGMIEHHEEEWDHNSNSTGADGFLGRLNEWRKKADAKLVEKAVPADPNKV